MDKRKLRILAIICAKRESKRFPNKNKILINDVIDKIMKSNWVTKTLIVTDDKDITVSRSKRILKIDRPNNACDPDDSVFNVARWAYYSLPEQYDVVIVILPNVIRFSSSYIGKAVRILWENDLNEVRTFDKRGVENGVIVMRKDWFLDGNLSVYCGAVISDAKEIHYEGELYK